MTIAEAFLQKLVDWRPEAQRQTLTFTEESSHWQVALTADRQEALSCLVWELSGCRAPAEPAAGSASLGLRAERLARRITGLREALKVVEVDVLRDEALLRSESPQQANDDIFYHEIRLQGAQGFLVRRYHVRPRSSARRERIPFAATHEMLAKLVGDLTTEP